MMKTAISPTFARGIRQFLRPLIAGSVLIMMAPGSWGASSPPAKPVTNGPSPQEMAYYKSIYELNIFDPNRIGPTPERDAPVLPKIDAFGLVGVMSYEKGQFAFFDGTSAEFKKALKVDDKIGDFTITLITDKLVKLKSADKEWELPLSTQLRRENKGEWKSLPMSGAFTASVDSGGSSRRSSFSSDSGGRNSSRNSSSGTDFGGRRGRGGFGQDGSTATPADPSSPAGGIMSNAAADSSASRPAADTSSSSNDGLSILERLKKKREQEQKQ